MNISPQHFRAGTRPSPLALLQTGIALRSLEQLLPGLSFDMVTLDTPGDKDRNTDLRESPPDFFTRDLDDAIRHGSIDCAIHSAKDLPDPMPDQPVQP